MVMKIPTIFKIRPGEIMKWQNHKPFRNPANEDFLKKVEQQAKLNLIKTTKIKRQQLKKDEHRSKEIDTIVEAL